MHPVYFILPEVIGAISVIMEEDETMKLPELMYYLYMADLKSMEDSHYPMFMSPLRELMQPEYVESEKYVELNQEDMTITLVQEGYKGKLSPYDIGLLEDVTEEDYE